MKYTVHNKVNKYRLYACEAKYTSSGSDVIGSCYRTHRHDRTTLRVTIE